MGISGKRRIGFEGVAPGDVMTIAHQDLKLNWRHYRRQVTGRPGAISDELTEEQVATIELRLDQAFAFISDVLENPALLEEIPGGSTLRFSDVLIGEAAFRLTAYPDAGPNWAWTAKVTGSADKVATGHERADVSRFGAEEARASTSAYLGHGHTAEEALAALEEKLRKAPYDLETDVRSGRRTT